VKFFLPLVIRGGVSNQPPNNPFSPSPANGATAQSLTTTLGWTGGDRDGDNVTYDVYFGTANPPATKVANRQSTLTYNPAMGVKTTYYWQIVAWDEHNFSTPGPVWSFTTNDVGPGEMVPIPAGPFQMGCDPAHNYIFTNCPFGELPLHTVTLNAYRIDKTEVTNAQYALCVATGKCRRPGFNSSQTRMFYGCISEKKFSYCQRQAGKKAKGKLVDRIHQRSG
jgi:formylglycine-generating enzyme required for sulfatase activity